MLGIGCGLANDALAFLRSTFSSRTSLIAENLFLRKQLAFYQEHQIKPRRLTNAARLSLVFWSRFFDWKSALVVAKPATLIGWHRKAFRLFWKWKSRPGRPRIPIDLRQLIAQWVGDNPTWGEERVADELWLKLGIKISPRTVRAYWPTESPSRYLRRASQNWNTFVRNHAKALLACDEAPPMNDRGMKLAPKSEVMEKFYETGTAIIARGPNMRLSIKDEGDFVKVGADYDKLTPTDLQLPSKSFATADEAVDFIERFLKQMSAKKLKPPKQ